MATKAQVKRKNPPAPEVVTNDPPAAQGFDYGEYSKAEKPGENVLARLTGMAHEQVKAEAEVARLEEELKKAQQRVKQIAEFDIPELMKECKMQDFTTEDGIQIDIKEIIRGGISEGNAEEAFKYLEDHKSGGIIKRQFIIEFSKADEAWAKLFQKQLERRKRKLNMKMKKSVHPGTLAAYIREQLELGVAIPMKTFGVFQQRISKVKVPVSEDAKRTTSAAFDHD